MRRATPLTRWAGADAARALGCTHLAGPGWHPSVEGQGGRSAARQATATRRCAGSAGRRHPESRGDPDGTVWPAWRAAVRCRRAICGGDGGTAHLKLLELPFPGQAGPIGTDRHPGVVSSLVPKRMGFVSASTMTRQVGGYWVHAGPRRRRPCRASPSDLDQAVTPRTPITREDNTALSWGGRFPEGHGLLASAMHATAGANCARWARAVRG